MLQQLRVMILLLNSLNHQLITRTILNRVQENRKVKDHSNNKKVKGLRKILASNQWEMMKRQFYNRKKQQMINKIEKMMRGEMMIRYYMRARLRNQNLKSKSYNWLKRSKTWSSNRKKYIILRKLKMRFRNKVTFRISLSVHINISKSFS